MEAQEAEAEEVVEELETGKAGECMRARRWKQHPVECRWRGENVQWVLRWKDGSAEAEEERTVECRKSAVWKYQKAGTMKPAGSDKTRRCHTEGS